MTPKFNKLIPELPLRLWFMKVLESFLMYSSLNSGKKLNKNKEILVIIQQLACVCSKTFLFFKMLQIFTHPNLGLYVFSVVGKCINLVG